MHVDAMAEEIPLAWRKKAPVDGRTKWYLTKTIRMPEIKHAAL